MNQTQNNNTMNQTQNNNKTVLIITLGNSDLQVKLSDNDNKSKQLFNVEEDLRKNRNQSGFYLLKNPREKGEEIFNNLSDYKSYLHYPIVAKALEYIKEKIDVIYFIVTDQNNNEEFKKNDTVFFGEILKKLLKEKQAYTNTKINIYKVQQNVIYYDSMYEFFGEKKCFLNHIAENSTVYLLPQGGIDAINTSLMLRCIEKFPKLKQLFVSEEDLVIEHNFPEKFKNNLQKHKLKELIQRYYYSEVMNFENLPSLFKNLCQYIIYNLNLENDKAIDYWEELIKNDTKNRQFFQKLPKLNAQQWLYLSIKIKLTHKQYADAVFRLFALQELVLYKKAGEFFGSEISNNMDQTKWKQLLEEKQLINKLDERRVKGNKLDYSKPSRIVLKEIYENFINDPNKKNWMQFFAQSEAFSELRNDFAHRGKGITEEDWKKALNENEDTFLTIMDQLFNVNGFLEVLNEKLIEYLNSEFK